MLVRPHAPFTPEEIRLRVSLQLERIRRTVVPPLHYLPAEGYEDTLQVERDYLTNLLDRATARQAPPSAEATTAIERAEAALEAIAAMFPQRIMRLLPDLERAAA